MSNGKAIAITAVWSCVAISAFGAGGYVVLIAFFAMVATSVITD